MGYLMMFNDGQSRLIKESEYKGEKNLHDLVEENPRLIPLPGIEEGSVVLLPVAREYLASDLLCVDSEGGITIVEFKLKKNQAMREIVAQILDYGSQLWQITYDEFNQRTQQYLRRDLVDAMFEACTLQNAIKEDEIEEDWKNNFRDKVINNLEKATFRLIVMADEIDEDTKRVVEYLYSLYSLDIYCVEVDYFQEGKGIEVLVPHLVEFGKRTSPRTPGEKGYPTSDEVFLEDREEAGGPKRKQMANELLSFAREQGWPCNFWKGKDMTSLRTSVQEGLKAFTVYSTGDLYIYFKSDPGIGVGQETFRNYMQKLNEIGIFAYSPDRDIGYARSSKGKIEEMTTQELKQLKDTIKWFLLEIQSTKRKKE